MANRRTNSPSTVVATRLTGIVRDLMMQRGRLAIFASTAAIGASNFGFHILGTRLLGPARYGALGSLLNLIILLDVPVTALQASVTQSTAEAIARKQGSFPARNLMAIALLVGSAGALAIGSMVPLIDRFLHLTSPTPAVLLAIWIIPTTLTACVQGLLIGQQRFKEAALSLSMGTGIVRLAAGGLLMLTVGGVTGAMAGTVIGQAVAVGLGCWFLRNDIIYAGSRQDTIRIPLTDGSLSLAALGGVAAFGGMDTLLARHFLTSRMAGNYAAAVNVGRVALFLSSAFSIVAFPAFVAMGGRGRLAKRALKRALTGLLVVSLGTAAVLDAGAATITKTLFGQDYPLAHIAVGPIAYSAASFAAVGLLTYFHLARRSKMAFCPLLGVAILCLLVAVAHSSVRVIAIDTLTASVSIAVVMAAAAFAPRTGRTVAGGVETP